MTSHDVVAQARRIFNTRAVGHAGTLDPMATGVLLLLFGEATKLSNYLTADDKRYRATVTFGRATDSLDADGTTTEEATIAPEQLREEALNAAIARELSRTRQVPPAVSAIKLEGRRAHALTRQGRAPVLAERAVAVSELQLIARSATTLTLELCVSKGYYVRAFARDLGASLGIPAHLSALRRLGSGGFDLASACPWPAPPDTPLIATAIAARRALRAAELNESGSRRARLGQPLELSDFEARPTGAAGETEAWFSQKGELVALGNECSPGTFKVTRGFRSEA